LVLFWNLQVFGLVKGSKVETRFGLYISRNLKEKIKKIASGDFFFGAVLKRLEGKFRFSLHLGDRFSMEKEQKSGC
jgi:hypothetical protein